MKRGDYPRISVIIPVYNEEENLARLFFSINMQTYPRNKIEYIVVNDNSTDNSRILAKKFGAKIIDVNTHDIELNKGIGLYAATGELVYWLDADMELCCENYFELLAKPLIKHTEFLGSFTKEFALDCKPKIRNSLLRFISYDPLQRDPLYQFFSPSIERTIIKKTSDYALCNFKPGHIPPCGRMMYRRKELLKTKVNQNKSFIDLETLEIVTRAGYNTFAYVPQAKIRHFHAESLKILIHKRLRNLERDYLPNLEKKYYTWFNLDSSKDIFKIFFWITYANLFVPELIRGILKSLWYWDYCFLWQPIVSVVTTDSILYGFISKPKGRKIVGLLLRKVGWE